MNKILNIIVVICIVLIGADLFWTSYCRSRGLAAYAPAPRAGAAARAGEGPAGMKGPAGAAEKAPAKPGASADSGVDDLEERIRLRTKVAELEECFSLPSRLSEEARKEYYTARAKEGFDTPEPETVRLGSYPQSGKDKEPIEWLVVHKYDGRTVCVISKYILQCRVFNEEDLVPTTWNLSSLRKWLNGEFYNAAFSDAEKARILTTTVHDSLEKTGPGYIEDKVFIPCKEEAETFLPDPKTRICPATQYAKDAGVMTDSMTNNDWWWIRGSKGYDPSVINGKGEAMRLPPMQEHIGVRPMMWITLK